MSGKCYYCQEDINIDHDAHSYCNEHKQIRVCEMCSMQKKKCPKEGCGKSLSDRGDSITKKTFFHQPTRDRLGF